MSSKREGDKTRMFSEEERTKVETGTTTPSSSVMTSLTEGHHSIDKTIDETRDNIKRTIEEARRDITRTTQAVNDCQEQAILAIRETADSYLESQKGIAKSFQSRWVPYLENTYGAFWNNWISPQRTAEDYARTVSTFVDNVIATNRLAHNAIVANTDVFKTLLQRMKDDAKELSKIGANAAKTLQLV